MQDSSGACRYAGCKKKEKPLESKWDGENTSPIPASHLDLLTAPIHGVFTTLMPDGQPQSSLVWCDFDGECARINTSLERQKYTSHLQYYGYVFPFEKRKHETRVICRIHAASVTLDAVHS